LSQASNAFASCLDAPKLQAEKSAELQKLVSEDQQDREGNVNSIDWTKVSPRDLERRIQVADIFAEGCFKDAKDYAAAALVFQHGDTADQAFQAFVWAKRAVELGDVQQKQLMAEGLDRYLVRSGQKQLFGTQATKDAKNPCWCLEPTEESFSDQRRVKYTKKTLNDHLSWVKSLNERQTACAKTQFCNHKFKPSPTGTVPGFW
jgi:hypothetical protein